MNGAAKDAPPANAGGAGGKRGPGIPTPGAAAGAPPAGDRYAVPQPGGMQEVDMEMGTSHQMAVRHNKTGSYQSTGGRHELGEERSGVHNAAHDDY